MSVGPSASLRLLVVAAVLGLSGCVVTAAPLLDRRPNVEPLPRFQSLADVTPPSTGAKEIVVDFPQTSPMFQPGDVINRGGIRSNSSVVINVPVDDPRTESEISQSRQSARAAGGYRGEAYFDLSEQMVEKALIRGGFNVIDRSKLEAKLRNRRDKSTSNVGSSTYTDAKKAAIAVLDEERDLGLLTQAEYEKKLAEVQRRYASHGLGSKRTEDEMVDISEVIRASEDGAVQVQYLLQINEFRVLPREDRPLPVLSDPTPELKRLLKDNPGLSRKLDKEVFIPWFTASCNAKLISISTGSIVWLGNLEISSQDVVPGGFDVVYEVDQSVRLSRGAREFDSQAEALWHDLRESYERLDTVIDRGMRSVRGKPRDVEDSLERQKKDLRRQERRYRDLLAAFNDLMRQRPDSETIWVYDYKVRRSVRPDYVLTEDSSRQDRERAEQHRADLARVAADTLIGSIKVGR